MARDKYKKSALVFSALPCGHTHEIGYDPALYVAEPVIEMYKRTPDELKQTDVYVFLGWYPAESKEEFEELRIYPIRKAKITNFRMEEKFYITLKVEEYLAYEDWRDCTNEIIEKIGRKNLPGEKGKFITLGTALKSVRLAEANHFANVWTHLIRDLAQLPESKNTAFWRVTHLMTEDQRDLLGEWGKLNIAKGYGVQPGKNYSLMLSFFFPLADSGGRNELELLVVADDNLVRVQGSKTINMRGRIDSKGIVFTCSKIKENIKTSLAINCNNAQDKYEAPEVEIPLSVRAATLRENAVRILLGIFFFAGLLLPQLANILVGVGVPTIIVGIPIVTLLQIIGPGISSLALVLLSMR